MSRSEDDYRTELIQNLNTRLPKPYRAHNSKTVIFEKVDPRAAIIGEKREFDIIIVNENFVSAKRINPDRIDIAIETKPLGSPLTGIGQAEDAFTAFPSLKETFATNFGSTFYHRAHDQAEDSIKLTSRDLTKRIEEMTNIIVKSVETIAYRPVPSTEPLNEKKVIDLLYDCMDIIQNQMTELPDETKTQLTERTLIMWQTAGNGSDPATLEYNVKRAASYIIVDQLLFYDLLQRHNTKHKLPQLKPLDTDTETPSLLYDKYMKRAIKITGDYRPILEIDVLSILPEVAPVVIAINEVITKIVGLQLSAGNTDFIGKIFHHMIPAELRKPIAAYYTGSAPARLLASLALTKSDMIVCDLACGSGTLLVESYHVLKEVYKNQSPSMTDDQIHKQLLENQIYGNDITLFASHLAAMNLAAQYLNGEVNILNITSTDGLQINPEGKKIYTTQGLFKAFGHESQSETADTVIMGDASSAIIFPKVDCMIMNPPFSRQTDMTTEVLENLTKITATWFSDKITREKFVDAKMGLHGYFILHADHMLKPKGRMAMVLPSSTFTTDYTTKLLAYLKSKRYSIEYVIETLSKRSAFSEDTTFKEYMIICRKGCLQADSTTRLISLRDEMALDAVPEIAQKIIAGEDHPNVIAQMKPTADLYASSKWTELFAAKSATIDAILESSKLAKYAENTSGITISSGYHGTYSEYLMVPNTEWTITQVNPTTFQLNHITIPEGDEQRSCQIPAKYLVPAIRTYEHINRFKTTADHWVLNLPPELPAELNDFRRKYIYWAENALESRWEEDRKKGNRRVSIIKKPIKTKVKDQWKYTQIPWYSHAWKNRCSQIQIQLIIFNKIYPNSARTTVCYIPSKIAVNHTFLTANSSDNEFLASWCDSGCYLYTLIKSAQSVSKGFIKFDIKDFANVKFPEYTEFDDATKADLIAKWQSLADLPDDRIPFLPQQFGADKVLKGKKKGQSNTIQKYDPLPERVALDNAWLTALGVSADQVETVRQELYAWLIDDMQTR